MIRKDKKLALLTSLLVSLIIAIIYSLLVESSLDYFVFSILLLPTFLLFLAIFTSIADIKRKQNVKVNIAFIVQSIFGLATWISLILCFSDIANNLKSITIVSFAISFILFIISFGITNAFEGN